MSRHLLVKGAAAHLRSIALKRQCDWKAKNVEIHTKEVWNCPIIWCHFHTSSRLGVPSIVESTVIQTVQSQISKAYTPASIWIRLANWWEGRKVSKDTRYGTNILKNVIIVDWHCHLCSGSISSYAIGASISISIYQPRRLRQLAAIITITTSMTFTGSRRKSPKKITCSRLVRLCPQRQWFAENCV